VDGVQVFTQERYSNTLSLATALATMTYGTYADNAGDFVNLDVANDHLNGYLDEVALYSKALTAAEIAAAWQAPLDTDDSDLVVYFNFDDGCPGNECANLGQAGDEMDMLLGSNFKGSKRLGPATGTATPGIGGAVCRLVTDGPIVFCDDATGPAVVGSGAPISGDGKPFVAAAIAGGDEVTFTLPGSDSADAALTFAVDDTGATGTVAVDTATGVVTYTADAGASGTDTFTCVPPPPLPLATRVFISSLTPTALARFARAGTPSKPAVSRPPPRPSPSSSPRCPPPLTSPCLSLRTAPPRSSSTPATPWALTPRARSPRSLRAGPSPCSTETTRSSA
jgi:hypothetical protein